MIERRSCLRIDGVFNVGCQLFCRQEGANLIALPMKDRRVNISATGIAFELSEPLQDWCDFECQISIECPNREVFSLSAFYVRHFEDKPSWIAFSFSDAPQTFSKNIRNYIHRFIALFVHHQNHFQPTIINQP
jgi:hypothetical protein